MIPQETEELIRSMLGDNLTDRYVANVAGVSHRTVQLIREACRVVRSLPEHSVERVRFLLIDGLNIKSIAEQTRLTLGSIRAVRRYYYLYRKPPVLSARPCPTCGAIMRPITEGEPKELKQSSEPAGLPTGEDALSLYRIAGDLVSLNSLRLITHPLFYHLACCAESTLEKINGKSTNSQ